MPVKIGIVIYIKNVGFIKVLNWSNFESVKKLLMFPNKKYSYNWISYYYKGNILPQDLLPKKYL